MKESDHKADQPRQIMTDLAQGGTVERKFTDFLSRLCGVRQKGDEYSAFCPVCENGKSSGDRHLYLRPDNGRILLDCKKGCSARDVCAALGKTEADLFADDAKTTELLREHIYYGISGEPVAKR